MRTFRPVVTITLAVGLAFTVSAQTWTPIPMVKAETKADPTVQYGGEGAQWPQGFAINDLDPPVMLYGTDVGGVYRSTDGGDTFEPANVGLHARGATDFAFDPAAPNRVLLVACNSLAMPQHGLYLSTNAGASWSHVLPAHLAGYRDFREQLAFDPSTFDADLGYTTDVYWSRIEHEVTSRGNPEINPAIYRSSDGGETWEALPDTTRYGGGFIAVHPAARGVIYSANDRGFFRSDDRGASWSQLDDIHYTSATVHPDRPDSVWASTAGDVRRSDDRGETWTVLPTNGLRHVGADRGHKPSSYRVPGAGLSFHDIKLSPTDPDRMSVSTDPGRYMWNLHASLDGGKTWSNAQFDRSNAFIPVNRRQPVAAWHPTRPNELWSTGIHGDWVARSDDAGSNFVWAADGINGILLGGVVRFNLFDPDLFFAGSQDYNGAVTRNGGDTWTYVNVANSPYGGHTYAGYAMSANVFIGGHSKSWGGVRKLRMSHDGGRSWQEHADVAWSKNRDRAKKHGVAVGHDAAYGHPSDPRIGFVAGFRTEDGGNTWLRMNGCIGVYAVAGESPHALFGVGSDGQSIVLSKDCGQTWQTVAQLDSNITDIAVTPNGMRAYVAFGGQLGVMDLAYPETLHVLPTPPDQFGQRDIGSVAVDPQRPDVIYATQSMKRYKSDAAALRSTDGGKTWAVLNVNTPLDGNNKDGGREANRVIVHPITRDAWFITGCFGVWRVNAPAATDTVVPRNWGPIKKVTLKQIQPQPAESFQSR